MKYFTDDFFELVDNVDDEAKRKSLMGKMHFQYWKSFDECSDRLPKHFVKYYKEHGFHDDVLNKLELVKRQTKNRTYIDIITQFRNEKKIYEIRYYDVSDYSSSITNLLSYAEIGDYIWGEILGADTGYLTHEFNFYDSRNIVKIKFKRLSFKFLLNQRKQQ